MRREWIGAVVGLLLAGCSLFPTSAQVNQADAATILGGLKAQGLPIGESVAYTAESDPNKLLGRPGGYTSKVAWRDTRLGDPLLTGVDAGGSIEVYADPAGAQRRGEYVRSIAESSPMFAEYTYVHGRAVLRISRELTSDQAEQYHAALTETAG
jgi:hypothetical protein